jgi:hypothetical protein
MTVKNTQIINLFLFLIDLKSNKYLKRVQRTDNCSNFLNYKLYGTYQLNISYRQYNHKGDVNDRKR